MPSKTKERNRMDVANWRARRKAKRAVWDAMFEEVKAAMIITIDRKSEPGRIKIGVNLEGRGLDLFTQLCAEMQVDRAAMFARLLKAGADFLKHDTNLLQEGE